MKARGERRVFMEREFCVLVFKRNEKSDGF